MKIVSITKYAKSLGLTRQAIVKRIKMNNPLPGVKAYYKSGSGKTSHFILILE